MRLIKIEGEEPKLLIVGDCRSQDDNGILYYVEKDLPLDAFDGISVLTWGRKLVADNKTGRAITIVNEDYKYSMILPGFTSESMTLFGNHYRTKKFNAQVNYIGIAGLTGKAIGWVTDDSESLPVRAMFEIAIGSIEIRFHHSSF